MVIRKITEVDIDEIVKIHLSSFDEKHFSKTFTKELLYEYVNLLVKYNQYKYVALQEAKACGYLIAGTKSQNALREFKKKYRSKIVIHLLKNPSFLIEKIREIATSFFKSEVKKTKMRLYLIAVKESEKGKGIGKKLVKHFEELLLRDQIMVYGLSVRKENHRGIRFYESTGYKKSGEDFKSVYFVKELGKEKL